MASGNASRGPKGDQQIKALIFALQFSLFTESKNKKRKTATSLLSHVSQNSVESLGEKKISNNMYM